MSEIIYAVCPRCGKRAAILSCRYDWDRDQDYARLKCACGKAEVPFAESRIRDVDLCNPYLKEERFRILIPEDWNEDTQYTVIGGIREPLWALRGDE